jgi:hypothetical protein
MSDQKWVRKNDPITDPNVMSHIIWAHAQTSFTSGADPVIQQCISLVEAIKVGNQSKVTLLDLCSRIITGLHQSTDLIKPGDVLKSLRIHLQGPTL